MSNRGIKTVKRVTRRANGLEHIRFILSDIDLSVPFRSYDDLYDKWDKSDDRHTFPRGWE